MTDEEKLQRQQERDQRRAERREWMNQHMPDIMSKASSVMGGVSSIANVYQDLSSIADTSGYWNDIEDVEDIGMSNYYDIDSLSQDYARMSDLNQMYNYRDIRGKNDGQLAMGVGTSMLQGAAAGASFGPYGAAAGAAIGLGAGLAGMFSGNRKARREQRYLTDRAEMAVYGANKNLNAAHEQLLDYQFRSGVSNRAAAGGKIDRKKSISNFVEKMRRKPRRASEDPVGRFIRTHKDGGTVVRIIR